MRSIVTGSFLTLVILLLGVGTASADYENQSIEVGAAPICPTRLHLRHPGMCSEQGSREDVVERALEGIDPQRPLPVSRVDPELGDVPFTYIRSKSKKGTPLYTSLDEAFAKEDPYRTVEPGFVFFSWIEQFRNDDGKKVYMIAPGVYVRSSGVSPLGLPTFRGMSFSRTPDKPFAWVLARNETRAGPGLDQPFTGRWINRFDVVTVFDIEEIGNWTWYKIGPNDWVDDHSLGIVFPDPEQPEGVQENRWISINLYEQTMTAYENGEMIYATLISSGLDGWWTQPGVFQVYSKLEIDPMQGAFAADRSDYYYLEDVPWILYYDESRAIHGAYWHNGYGYPRSHGCVNISPADAEWFYNFANEGTWVYVFDPTGETPTDEELYGSGGA
jgi:hypothetical protein